MKKKNLVGMRTYLLPVTSLCHQGKCHGTALCRLSRASGHGWFTISRSHRERHIKQLFALELARFKAFRHHFGVLSFKFCFVFGIYSFLLSGNNDGLVIFAFMGGVIVAILFTMLFSRLIL